LITRPVEVGEAALLLNVDASHGILRVAIASGDTVPTFDGSTPSNAPHLLPQHLLPGLGFDDCEVVTTNSIEHSVRFKNGASVAALRGQRVALLFEMVNAHLYGFCL
jgi:hypothetical protein